MTSITPSLLQARAALEALAKPPAATEEIRVELLSSLAALDAAALDRITSRSSVFFDAGWFRLIESVDLARLVGGEIALHYVVARRGGEPIALCPFLVTRSTSVHLFYSLEKFFFTPWWFPGVKKHAPDKEGQAKWARIAQSVFATLARAARAGLDGWVLAVSPLSHRANIAIAPSSPSEEAVVRDAVIKKLQDVATDEGLPLCFLGLQEDADELRCSLSLRGFEEVFVAYDNLLKVDVPSFESYLGLFKSDARRLFNREIRQAREGGVRFERTNNLGVLGSVLDRLYRNTSLKYGEDHFQQPPEFWAALERNLGANAEVVLARDADGVAGFSLLLHRNGELWFHRVGRSYESDSSDASVYFNLAFYEPVKRAIELGAKRIWLGFGAWEAKRRRGAVAHPISSAFWFPSRWSRALLGPYLRKFGRVSQSAMAPVLQPCSYLKAEPAKEGPRT